MPVIRDHYVMLQSNLLYTAITRARQSAVLVGQDAAIRRAVTNVGSRQRYSRLAARRRQPGRSGDLMIGLTGGRQIRLPPGLEN